MINAVFFDWFNTLAHYEPTREDTGSLVLRDLGFDVPVDRLRRAIATADKGWFRENTRSNIRRRSAEEQAREYTRYQQTVLTELGIDTAGRPEIVTTLTSRMQEMSKGMRFALFDDVVPALQSLKARGLTLALVTNVDRGMDAISRQLGLDTMIDVIVTSGEVGQDKPGPLIFQAALDRARVEPAQTIHVGDQYGVDVVGARGVGIAPLLLDRYDFSTEVADCPRIHTLTEVERYLG